LVEENLQDWSTTASSSKLRWINIFKTLKQQNCPIEKFKKMVEFAFSILFRQLKSSGISQLSLTFGAPKRRQMTIDIYYHHVRAKNIVLAMVQEKNN
jgi:hypothetical protein